MNGNHLALGMLEPGASVLILSDIHGNWPALQAVIRAEPALTEIVCLGDTVNYGPHPAECVRWVRRSVAAGRSVLGNHDWAASTGESPGITREDSDTMDAILRHTRGALSHDERHFLGSLPRSATVSVGTSRWHLCHGLPSDPLRGYLRQSAAVEEWRREVRLAGNPTALLLGHTHRPFIRKIDGTLVVNPGSVGRPKDGDPRAAYAVWEKGVFSLRRIAYDIRRAGDPISGDGRPRSDRGARKRRDKPLGGGPLT